VRGAAEEEGEAARRRAEDEFFWSATNDGRRRAGFGKETNTATSSQRLRAARATFIIAHTSFVVHRSRRRLFVLPSGGRSLARESPPSRRDASATPRLPRRVQCVFPSHGKEPSESFWNDAVATSGSTTTGARATTGGLSVLLWIGFHPFGRGHTFPDAGLNELSRSLSRTATCFMPTVESSRNPSFVCAGEAIGQSNVLPVKR